ALLLENGCYGCGHVLAQCPVQRLVPGGRCQLSCSRGDLQLTSQLVEVDAVAHERQRDLQGSDQVLGGQLDVFEAERLLLGGGETDVEKMFDTYVVGGEHRIVQLPDTSRAVQV